MASQLRERIVSGAWAGGQRLGSELELTHEFGVSRVTVRKAISVLRDEGLVISRQGLGTFVRLVRAEQVLDRLETLDESLHNQGLKSVIEVVKFAYSQPRKPVQRMLELADGEEVLSISRLHSTSSGPVGLVEIAVPASVARLCRRKDIEEVPFYDLLPRIGINLGKAHQVIRAAAATKQFAAISGVAERAPVLVCERVTLDTHQRPMIHAVFTYRSDRFEFSIDLPVKRGITEWSPPGFSMTGNSIEPDKQRGKVNRR